MQSLEQKRRSPVVADGWKKATRAPTSDRRLGYGSLAVPGEPFPREARAFAQTKLLQAMRDAEPAILRSLAELAGWTGEGTGTASVETSALAAWAFRWNLADDWCLAVARHTVGAWHGPTWQMLRDECANDRRDWLNNLDWTYPVAIVADPLDDDATAIPPLDPAFLDWNPRLVTWEQAETRMIEAFRKHIGRHRDGIRAAAERAGMDMTTVKRSPEHFTWLALYQVGRGKDGKPYSQSDLAKLYGVTRQSMNQALDEAASLCDLTLRPRSKAGRRAKPHARTVRVQRARDMP